MTLQKIALSLVATAASLALTPALRADPHVALAGFGLSVAGPDAGIGFWIAGGHPDRHVYRVPPYRYYYGYPWRPDYVRVVPPVVVVPPVAVAPAPPVAVVPAPAIIPNGVVTVWFINSNGSRTSIQLTRHGPWYVGPRGEYYDRVPTNEQLRQAYGF